MPSGIWESVHQAYHGNLLIDVVECAIFFGVKQSESSSWYSCPAESLEDSRSFQRRSEVATSPRRNMMSEVIVKASHFWHQRGAGWVMFDQGITTKTKPTIYNYDTMKVAKNPVQIGWRVKSSYQKNRKPQKTKWISIQLRKWQFLGPGRAMGFTRGHGIMENMGKTWGKHGENMDTFWTSIGSKRTQERNSSCSVVWTNSSFAPSHWQKSFQRPLKITFVQYWYVINDEMVKLCKTLVHLHLILPTSTNRPFLAPKISIHRQTTWIHLRRCGASERKAPTKPLPWRWNLECNKKYRKKWGRHREKRKIQVFI